MSYKIAFVEGAPQFSALPAFKMQHYPLGNGSKDIFAQVKLCFTQTHLHLRSIAFEVTPLPQSRLVSAFCLDDSGALLVVDCEGAAVNVYSDDGHTQTPVAHTEHYFTGEDLQGMFWAVDTTISLEDLAEHFTNPSLCKGQILKANFYKTCTDDGFKHYGSFYPCDFTKQDFISGAQMAEFEIVDY